MDNVLQYHNCDSAEVVPAAALNARIDTNLSSSAKNDENEG
jgi:hypothetical protein